MKKSLCLVLIIVLLVGAVPAAMAAGSAYMIGPSVVRAGDTITVSFSAGGGIYGGNGTLSYDTAQVTLQGCSAAIGGSWAVEFNGNNFLFYDNSMAAPISDAVIFTATFAVNRTLPVGTKISISANNVTLSNGQTDMHMGTATYSASIAAPLSNNCRLASLTVDNASIVPAFSPDVLEYTAAVPFEVSALRVTATAEHGGARTRIENPALAVAATTDVKITVTAENGASKTYVIHVSRAQDPNYVPSDNAKLRELSVEGYSLSPVFSADVTQYYVWLPYEAETAAVKAETEDQRASLVIGELAELIPGQANDIPVTVTAENGTVQVYTVTVVRAPKHEDVDAFLQGEPEPTVPTVPETEPTEPKPTVPTVHETEPTVPKDDVHADVPLPPLPVLIAVSLGCVLLGAIVGVAATLAVNKKKSKKDERNQ